MMNQERILGIAGQGYRLCEVVSRESDKRGVKNQYEVRGLGLAG